MNVELKLVFLCLKFKVFDSILKQALVNIKLKIQSLKTPKSYQLNTVWPQLSCVHEEGRLNILIKSKSTSGY